MGVEKNSPKDSENEVNNINNIKEWVDQQLFVFTLQLEDKPKEFVRNIISLSC